MTLRARALKVATRDLVDSLAGFEAAATRCFVGKTQLERCANKDHENSFLNLRDAVELERYAPRPLITMELCRQAGGVFLPLPETFGDDGGLPMQVMALSRELGDVSRSVSEALADSEIKPREAAAIESEIDQLIEVAVQARAFVRGLQGKDVGSVAAPSDAGRDASAPLGSPRTSSGGRSALRTVEPSDGAWRDVASVTVIREAGEG